jgi:hypothetical protein
LELARSRWEATLAYPKAAAREYPKVAAQEYRSVVAPAYWYPLGSEYPKEREAGASRKS